MDEWEVSGEDQRRGYPINDSGCINILKRRKDIDINPLGLVPMLEMFNSQLEPIVLHRVEEVRIDLRIISLKLSRIIHPP